MKKLSFFLYLAITLIFITPQGIYSDEGDQLLKSFEKWVRDTTEHLASHSHIAETSRGPIEYKRYGDGPVVLCLHGGPGGYDQSFLIGTFLLKHKFTVIGVSRPGYLRTPLSVGATNEEQADAIAALLDVLDIPQAAVLGFSAGGPVAFQFALRHPDRCWAQVLESIGARQEDSATYKLLVQILQLGPIADFGGWIFNLGIKHRWHSTATQVLSSDNSLPPNTLHERIDFVLGSKNQRKFMKRFLRSILPFSPRTEGLINDVSITNINQWPTYPYSLIVTPTLIVQSRDDSNGSYTEAKNAAEQIPGAQLIKVRNSGHFVWLGEDTDQWEKNVIKFLKTHSP